jgi:hypothetical protein
MKKIILSAIIIITACSGLNAQQAGIALYAAPAFTKVKYNDFNTFADSYNTVNGYNLKGFSKMSTGFSTGADAYYNIFYWGLYYNRLNKSADPVKLDAISERQFDLRLRSWIANIGWNMGRGPISFSPYIAMGMNYLDLDAYINYYGKYKSYGNYKLDGTYSGTNMLVGFGLKANFFFNIFYASLGITKLYSAFPTASIHDFGSKGDPVTGGGYTDIGTDWATYTTGNSWDYTGKYVSSSNKQFIIQLSAGIFIGKTGN